jgi:archaellum component FlaC/predicted RNA-binding Zn-ribbon protein involved in translation (DUF1610 family)
MEINDIDAGKLNKALDKFGSLQKAIKQMEQEMVTLRKQNSELKKGNDKLSALRNKLASQIEGKGTKVQNLQNQLQSLANKIDVYGSQYELFCGFMAMVTESPSVTDSIDNLIKIFLKLKEPGWYLPKDPDVLRSLFIRVLMGDYLKYYRCDACGARFITNKKAEVKYLGTGYHCPVCHYLYAVKPDDSFLKAGFT